MDFLPILWFILIAVLWAGYLTLEGFDFGVGMLYTTMSRNPKERRVALNTIGPHWDGNEVWLLTAGGATFAAFPEWYATMFSGMYLALALILVLLIVRICALEWRGKINDEQWRNRWDIVHTASAWLVSILWGVAFANLVQGMEIEVIDIIDPATQTWEVVPAGVLETASAAEAAGFTHHLTGGFFSLLTPFTILGGLVTLTLFLSHGAIFIALKTSGELQVRAEKYAARLSLISLGVTAVWALWAQLAYASGMWSWIPLAIAALCLAATALFAQKGDELKAFIANFVAIASAVAFIFIAMAPNVMKSSIDPAYSLTIEQASATGPTQIIMSFAALVFVPIIIGYSIWSYKVFSKRISVDDLPDKAAGLPGVYNRSMF
ncbi:cytochrome d ubiquinol oxidase subunit II [Flaviflexus equikiangi]|uniref:Cytochrome d ubiquinol oxidase subunit II n=1 Tax=Flaviflexus equikiangi TaxID=2758573 RepID=A0ABS2TH34_9ACTO|nr:cytochrome d ubiquinol oxidase subunit II [Flaviflexus equikiangi]MBM9432851.1 cytochrome d ubiquinol oxidase subunit II [Flaviflexus equikiangi]